MTDRDRGVIRATLQVVGILLAVVTALWLLYRVVGILFLLFLSMLFGFVLGPLIELLQRPVRLRGRAYALPLSGAIGAAYVVLFGTLAAAVVLLLPVVNEQFADFLKEAPGYLARLDRHWQAWLQGHTRAFPREMRASVDRGLQAGLAAGGEHLQKVWLPRAAGWLARAPWLVLTPILTFFLFKDAALFRESVLDALGSRRLKRRGEAFFESASRALAAYIRAQLLACSIVGILCTGFYLAVGIPYAVILGVVAGLFEFVPLVGPLVAGLAAVTAASLHSGAQAATVLGFLLVLRVVQDYVVYPKLIGREVHVHPLAVILAILCGGEVAGLPGIIAAVPLLTVLNVSYRHWKRHREQEVARPGGAVAKSA